MMAGLVARYRTYHGFRKRRRSVSRRSRGVSDVIAVILLGAITVVLAAVLYVLVSGVVHGVGTEPLGAHFSWGRPLNVTSVTPASVGCGTPGVPYAVCYSIEVSTSSIATSNLVLALQNSAGATVAWPVGVAAGVASIPTGSQISLVDPTRAAPVAGYSTSASSWTDASGFSGGISAGDTIVIYLVGTASLNAGLYGDHIVAVGTNGFSDGVTSDTFP